MFSDKQPVRARWIAVMNHVRTKRCIVLTDFRTRCVQSGEIHEFITCESSTSGVPIDDVSYLGFAEIVDGGVLQIGDEIQLNDKLAVRILGFDYTHMPNHMNILVVAPNRVTGSEAGLRVGQDFYAKQTQSTC